jgi:hypothetical protein
LFCNTDVLDAVAEAGTNIGWGGLPFMAADSTGRFSLAKLNKGVNQWYYVRIYVVLDIKNTV